MVKVKLLRYRLYFILFVLLSLPVILFLLPVEWFTNTGHTLCVWKNITGHDCYGCGTTRALLSVFHGEFMQAYSYNKLIVVTMPVLVYLWARWVQNIVKKLRYTIRNTRNTTQTIATIANEKHTVELMIRLYCRGNHHDQSNQPQKDQEDRNYNNTSKNSTITHNNTPNNTSNNNTRNNHPIGNDNTLSDNNTPHNNNNNNDNNNNNNNNNLNNDNLYKGHTDLCPDCRKLMVYAHARLDNCPYSDRKKSCKQCTTHCYSNQMRQQIRCVMRYAGPRMILYAPLATLRHILHQ